MIKIISSSELKRLKELEKRVITLEDELYYLNNSTKQKERNVICSATRCMDNENGRCILQSLSIAGNGTCNDYDVEGAMREFLDESKKGFLNAR